MLTQEKVADTDKHFRIVGEEAYCAAGGTFTTDLFGERRYCDDAGLVMDLVQDRLDAIAKAAREDGWRDAEGQLYRPRSEEHTSELQSLMRISYAVFCLKKKKVNKRQQHR